eukprot:CAMPEP_0185192180 /NCGR_PEP_ID=MMETSP1140-20130426/17793_1 /TAXON_ID=298111 /ORGANISM="Pavlova sp., Strain CCMP459" /LENGTH=161 /DNA_ID=CAMNT_0027758913 /DNA_START=615 /DNA_END=1100 /DNA_ORIENTATION=-
MGPKARATPRQVISRLVPGLVVLWEELARYSLLVREIPPLRTPSAIRAPKIAFGQRIRQRAQVPNALLNLKISTRRKQLKPPPVHYTATRPTTLPTTVAILTCRTTFRLYRSEPQHADAPRTTLVAGRTSTAQQRPESSRESEARARNRQYDTPTMYVRSY